MITMELELTFLNLIQSQNSCFRDYRANIRQCGIQKKIQTKIRLQWQNSIAQAGIVIDR